MDRSHNNLSAAAFEGYYNFAAKSGCPRCHSAITASISLNVVCEHMSGSRTNAPTTGSNGRRNASNNGENRTANASGTAFNPKLIFSQIVAMQCFHYLVLGVMFQINHVLYSTSITVDRMFTDKYLRLWSLIGWADNMAVLLSSIVGVGLVWLWP